MDCSLLLVDDEANIPRAMKRALRNEGYNIFLANNGVDALNVLEEKPIDIVVSDHRMPGMSGADLLSRIAEKYPDTVRIMVSGEADMEAVVRAVNEGSIYKFFTKPWVNDTLRATLREAAIIAANQKSSHDVTQVKASFMESLDHITDGYLVVFEVRNLSALKLLTSDQINEVSEQITDRCRTHFGSVLHPAVCLEEGVISLVCPVVKHELMEELASLVNIPFNLDQQITPLRIATGYSEKSDCSADIWLQNALVALTATSFSGEVTAYSADIQAGLHDLHSLEQDMREGLTNGEFFLQFQPQVNSQTLRIEGVEALCRWAHHERGMISPLQFIDLAEKNGFIHELGLWVMQESCSVLQSLGARGFDGIRVSFNVSPRQFTQSNWTDVLLDYVQSSELDPQNLEVEITESTVMADPKLALAAMEKLKRRGICIAMDDFGTGHSSLGLINELPIDVIKFDRSLIKNIVHDKKCRTLFEHLAQMTHELGLETIVEGVESQEQVAMCQAVGCNLIQGYVFHKPVDTTQFFQLLEGEHHARH